MVWARVSLTARATASVVAVLALCLLGAGVAVNRLVGESAMSQLDASLARAARAVADELRTKGTISYFELSRLAPGMFVELVGPDGSPVSHLLYAASPGSSRQYDPALPDRLPTSVLRAGVVFLDTRSTSPRGPSFRAVVYPLQDGTYLVLAEPATEVSRMLESLTKFELLAGFVAVAAGAAGSYLFVALGLRPLSGIAAAARRISAATAGPAVPEAGPPEIRQVAAALNAMLSRIAEGIAQLEAARSRLQASQEGMRRFLADASHELRTPIAAVLASAQLMGDPRLDADKARELLASLTRESERLAAMADSLLALLRLGEPSRLRLAQVDVMEVAFEAKRSSELISPDHPIEIEGPEHLLIQADRAVMEGVFDNLFSNARLHTPPGTLTRVSVRPLAEGGIDLVEVMVEDSGPGVPEEALERVFDRFFALRQGGDRRGTGLGLSIVRAAVEAHGGEAKAARSELGGLRIVLRLPRMACAAGNAARGPSLQGLPAAEVRCLTS
jgi:two-component system OmpR family sensor kinase